MFTLAPNGATEYTKYYMKYEYAPEDEGKREATAALVRLGADFARVGTRYFDARVALEGFLYADLGLGDDESGLYILQLESEGVLPSAEQYEQDGDAALAMHRMALFTHWMSLYRELGPRSDRFSDWVVQMIEVAVPRGGEHTAACRDDRALSALGTDQLAPCWTAAACPVNTIAAHVLQKTPFLPSHPEEYDVFDAQRAKRDAMSLIQAVAGRGLITPAETREAARDVREMYHYLTA